MKYVILITSLVYLWYSVCNRKSEILCMCSRSNCPTVLDKLKLGRCFWIIFQVLWQILFSKGCVCKFITACLDYRLFEFFSKKYFWQYMLSRYLPLQILLSSVFPKETSIWFLILVAGLGIILPHPRHSEQVCFHCFRPVVQFSQEICSKTYSIVLARCLWSLFLTSAMFIKLLLMIGCIHRIEVG